MCPRSLQNGDGIIQITRVYQGRQPEGRPRSFFERLLIVVTVGARQVWKATTLKEFHGGRASFTVFEPVAGAGGRRAGPSTGRTGVG